VTTKRAGTLWLLGICTLALALRLYKLGAPLWYDEILTLARFVRLPLGELLTTYTSLNNHVLFSLQAKLCSSLFGESAAVLRLPAVIMGVLSIAAIYQLARKELGSWDARLTAILLAVSYHHIWFSQNARGYTGLLFWTTLASMAALRALPAQSLKAWIPFALCVALAGYTHLSAAMVFVGHAAVFALLALGLFPRSKLNDSYSKPELAAMGRRALVGLALGAALTAALHAPMVPDMLHTYSTFAGVGPAAAASPPAPAAAASYGKSPLWTALEVLRSFGGLGPLLVVAAPLAATLLLLGGRDLWRRSPVLLAIYAVQIPAMLLILLAAHLRIWPRYFFVDIAFLLLALVRGVFVLSAWLAERLALTRKTGLNAETLGVIAGLVGVAASLPLLPKNYSLPKQDFEGAMRFVQAERKLGDAVGVIGLANLPYEEFYKPGFDSVRTPQDLERLREQPGKTWLIYAFSSHTKSHFADLMTMIAEGEFEKARVLPGTLGDGTVYVLRSNR
jgi:mannosyltransferase